MTLELGQGIAFFGKSCQSVVEIVAVARTDRADGKAILSPRGNLHGKIFFNGELGVQFQVAAEISDAEAALAEGAANNIFILQNRARRQLLGIFRATIKIAALRTYPQLSLAVHTAHA